MQHFNVVKSLAALSASALFMFTLNSCERTSQQSTTSTKPNTPKRSPEPEESETLIKIQFTYGSEKAKWIRQATETFNNQKLKTATGRTIFVSHNPMGSGACINDILEGTAKTHLVSPASAVFIDLGNAESNTQTGSDLVGQTKKLCLSPVVIAMWQPMAEALGHGKHPIGWKEVIDIAQNPKGWAAYDMAQWGQFRFGHTHPDFSNSGIISLIAETYAAAGKQSQLTSADVNKPSTGDYLENIEQAIVHYGKSTGFFGRKMFANGPRYLSAAVLYENMGIESYEHNLDFPVVAVYPKEGTFYSDHPVGIVQREWVTDEHKEACEAYTDFLLSKDQQEKAMQFGFRPSDLKIPLNEKFTAKYGVDKNQPQTLLEVPSVPVIQDIRSLWLKKKKKSHIVLAIDCSDSMNRNGKIQAARKGALQMLEQLGDEDTLSLLTFNSEVNWINKDAKVGTNRKQLHRQISLLLANKKTALYDAIYQGFKHLQNSPDKENKITAVVVLSDGANTSGGITTTKSLLKQIGIDAEDQGTRIFTIAYGSGATPKDLEAIANSAKGKNYKSDTTNIKKIFLEISTFF